MDARKIILKDSEITYKLVKSTRAKHLRISVKPGGILVVTIPSRVKVDHATKFIIDKQDWILKTLKKSKDVPIKRLKGDAKEYKLNKRKAFEIAQKKVEEFNRFYNFSYNKISIKNNKTRWGSCSIDRNLNFHYKIAFLDEELANYLVVHELCHLKEMNHSQRFWDLVAKTIPNYKVLRKTMRNLA